MKARVLMFAFPVALFASITASGIPQEVVLKTQLGTPDGTDIRGVYMYPSFCDPHDVARCSFKVYTKEDVDGQVGSLQSQVAFLHQQVQTLSLQIKTLSDTNDALTKRLDTLEAKISARQSSH